MKYTDLKTEATDMCKALGLDPDGFLDKGDERINRKSWEYLLPLAGKLAAIRAKENGREHVAEVNRKKNIL